MGEIARVLGDGELVEHAPGRARRDRLGQDGEAADGLGQHIEHGRHARRVRLAQRPGRLGVDVAVGLGDDAPLGGQSGVELLDQQVLAHGVEQPARRVQQRLVTGVKRARRGHLAAAVLGDHRQHALRQIAEVVGQVAVYPAHHGAVREVAVVAERHLAQHEIAHLVEAVALDQPERLDDVAQRLGDFLAAAGPPAMGEDPPRRCDPGGHQEGRPVDRVEAQDVLADHVDVGRPVAAEIGRVGVGIAGRRDVVGQRVDPNVHHMVGIVGHRHAPLETGARDREVVEPALDEADNLVAPRLGQDEIRVRVVEREQPLLPGREAEEIARLLDPFDRRAGRRQTVDQLALGVERLVAHRIPAGIGAEVDFVALDQLAPQLLDRFRVPCLGRADEIVIGQAHRLAQIAEALRDPVDEGLRVLARRDRRLLDLLAVLVGAGQEHDVAAVEPHEPRQRVARNRRVDVADVRHVVDVVNRRRDVVGLGLGHGGHANAR